MVSYKLDKPRWSTNPAEEGCAIERMECRCRKPGCVPDIVDKSGRFE